MRTEVESRDRYRQTKPARSGASGIDIEHAPKFFSAKLVGMAAYDNLEVRCCWIEVKIIDVMQDIDLGGFRLNDRGRRQSFGPFARIDVPANRLDGGQLLQRLDDFGLSHITRMDDQLAASERL